MKTLFPALPSPCALRNPCSWDCSDGPNVAKLGCHVPALAVSLGACRVGRRQVCLGGSQSVPTELHRFHWPHRGRGGEAGTRASHSAITREPKGQHFDQLLSEVRCYKLYFLLTGASSIFPIGFCVKTSPDSKRHEFLRPSFSSYFHIYGSPQDLGIIFTQYMFAS